MTMTARLSIRSIVAAGVTALALLSAPAALASDRYAAIVFDATTNEVLHADQADERRYPASLTKMMTLYLLFDALERGEIRLTDTIVASRRAQQQPPSRLGVRAGDTVMVEDAIQALVTRSANDVAVMVAEKLEGSESRFAARMTAKARALGMRDTRYANASGLPDPGQITTARDMLVLSQALFRDHPNRYRYFQTASFSWRNIYARNHNSLLGRVEGVDGIKTGYTRASGFNLASSAQRNGHRIFAVVLGGESAAARDAQMAFLIDNAFSAIEARATGRPVAPTAVYTSLPAPNRVGGALPNSPLPPAPSLSEEEDMGAVAVNASGAAVIEQGSADGSSYVTPFATNARPTRAPPTAEAAPAPTQIRGPSSPDPEPVADGMGATTRSP